MKNYLLSFVALTAVIVGIMFLANQADDAATPTASATTAVQSSDENLSPTESTAEVEVVVPGPNTEKPAMYLESTRVAAESWKAERGYLDANADSSTLQYQYESYDDETLQAMSDSGDGLASIILAERLEMRDGQRDRVKELYLAAAVAGKTAAFNELATYQLNSNVFGDSPIVRVDDSGNVTDEYIEQLAYYAAAELTMDPLGSMLLEFNIRAEHRQQVMDRMADICANAKLLIDRVQFERLEQGKDPLNYEFDADVFPVTDVTWHCQKSNDNAQEGQA